MQEQTLFIEALEKEDPAERAAFLDRACAGDVALRQRIERLLQRHKEADSLLDRPAVAPAVTGEYTPDPGREPATRHTPEIREGAGTLIGPYKLLQQIGEGGMGVVFMAEQTQPVQRKVALKIIKAGMDSGQVLARFEAERQALALMDHPNIARVLDAGTVGGQQSAVSSQEEHSCSVPTATRPLPTEQGRPYFVMELVKGLPMTKYCDERRLTLRERLELFIPVCHAVHHAHQKGIIHRDLKPSNVLVTQYDGKPVPKVIDFGIAKATGQKLTERTLFTEFGAVVGTLEYMSPEQAELNQLDIDTRSDVYSLGVLLYELLTGTTPLSRKRLGDAAFLEVLRIIREEDPPTPSNRLSTTEELPLVAANRGLEPKRLSGLVKGELDWIVMKALEKDRNRRYESASAFAADVQRYLSDEAVQACPPSVAYRLRKFVRRHKAGLLTTAAVVLIMLLAAGGIGWTLWNQAAQQAKRLAETEGEAGPKVVTAEQLEEQAKKMPIATSVQAAAALGAWRQADDTLAQAEAAMSTGEASDTLRQRVAAVRARLSRGRRQTEQALERASRKEKLIRNLDEARMARLGLVDQRFGHAGAMVKYAAAFAEYNLAVKPDRRDEVARRIRAEEPDVRAALLVALDDWAFAAELVPNASEAASLRALAQAADDDGWRRRYRAAVADKDLTTLRSLSAEARRSSLPPASLVLLANSLVMRREHDGALAVLRRGQALHPTDFWLHFQLGSCLSKEDSHTPEEAAEAMGCYRAALALRPKASAVHNNLGRLLYSLKRLDEAIDAFYNAIEHDPTSAKAHNNLGIVLRDKHQPNDAIACFRKAIEHDPKFAFAHNMLAETLQAKGQLAEAIAGFRESVKHDPSVATTHNNLGLALYATHQLRESIAEFRESIKLAPRVASTHYNLGIALAAVKRSDAAIAAFREAIAIDPTDAKAHYNLGAFLFSSRQLDDAITSFRNAINRDGKYADAYYALGVALKAINQVDDAIAAYRNAIKFGLRSVEAHTDLGVALATKCLWDEAIVEYREAIKIDPRAAKSYNNLGNALAAKNQLDDAIAAFREAIKINSNYALVHQNLGTALFSKNHLKDAIAAFRKAIEIDPKSGSAHADLGKALMFAGRFAEAQRSMQVALIRLPEGHEERSGISRQLQQCKGLINLETKLPDVLVGTTQPKDTRERLGFITVCRLQERFAAAARLYAEGFRADARLSDDLGAAHRYLATCCAVRAAAGHGIDAAKLDQEERDRLCRQARDWLRADMASWSKRLADGTANDGQAARTMLQRWQGSPDLASVRDGAALEKLSVKQRAEWLKLWADVAEVLKKTGNAR
jgi:serine/threonine protein kinase/Tfp pilus assembly protein PilF